MWALVSPSQGEYVPPHLVAHLIGHISALGLLMTHTHTTARSLALVAATLGLGVAGSASAAAADDEGGRDHRHVVGNATGGGSVPGAVSAPVSKAEQAHAQRKLDRALAYSAQVEQHEQTAARNGASPQSCPPQDPCPPPSRVLAVDHAGQIKDYYCGPATGFMILRYEGEGASAYNGAALTQTNVAGPNHMRTDINGSTPWLSNAFRDGLNRWRQGTDTGFYVKLPDPSNSQLRAALVSDIDNHMPFGVSTIESRGELHYNGHPRDQLIGHWIAAQGYLNSRDTASFDDPAGNSPALSFYWDDVQPNFTYGTDNFNQTFVRTHGIVW